MLEIICQIMIPLFSGLGVFFVSKDDDTKKYGYIFGLCSQPFWIITLYTHRQWGLFLLSLFFTTQWIKGIYNYWLKREKIRTVFKYPQNCPYCKKDIISYIQKTIIKGQKS